MNVYSFNFAKALWSLHQLWPPTAHGKARMTIIPVIQLERLHIIRVYLGYKWIDPSQSTQAYVERVILEVTEINDNK